MKECVWVKPRIVAEIEFPAGNGPDHLRHTKFVGLRMTRIPSMSLGRSDDCYGAVRVTRRKGLELNLCEVIGNHHLCLGITSLQAGDFDLGTVARNCLCHKKPEE
jgi:hypothetical protein